MAQAQTTNPVFEAVRTVMAVRQYAARPVPDDVIERIVEAGRLTASSQNGQPWHFVVVRERENLRELGKLIRTGPYVANAAFAIVVAYSERNQYGVSDVSRAIQSMILSAWGEGVGSNWTGFGGMDGVRKQVGLPEAFDVMAVLPFGYPAKPIIGKKKRKPFKDVVSEERYGTPLEK